LNRRLLRWLDTALPKREKSRDVLRPQLNQLGALRLLRHTNGDWSEAERLTADEKDHSLYNTQARWIEARKAAQEILEKEFSR
jgi:hypothetical protein